MTSMADIAVALSSVARPHIHHVALSFVATLVFIFGEDIHGIVKQQIKNRTFLIRLLILITVCAFGYGTLTIFLTRLVAYALRSVTNLYLAPIILGAFLVVGLVAERKRQM